MVLGLILFAQWLSNGRVMRRNGGESIKLQRASCFLLSKLAITLDSGLEKLCRRAWGEDFEKHKRNALQVCCSSSVCLCLRFRHFLACFSGESQVSSRLISPTTDHKHLLCSVSYVWLFPYYRITYCSHFLCKDVVEGSSELNELILCSTTEIMS